MGFRGENDAFLILRYGVTQKFCADCRDFQIICYYAMLLYYAILYYTILYYTILYYTILYYIILY